MAITGINPSLTMRKALFLLFSTVFVFNFSFAQPKTDKKLQREIANMIQGFHGDIGVYVKDLRKNKIVALNADSIFPTASMVKIPILVGVMDKIEKRRIKVS